MTLKERAVARHAYNVIETRGPKVSLYLLWRDGIDDSSYEIRSGVRSPAFERSGATSDIVLQVVVPRGTGPWRRR